MQVHKLLELGHAVSGASCHSCVVRVVPELSRKLLVVDPAVTVSVDLLQHLVNLSRCDPQSEASDGVPEFYLGDEAIAILIKLVEDLLDGLGGGGDDDA